MKLVVEGLEAAHGRTQALFGVSLELEEGGRCCVLGRNGVGKTSLMNAIMGVLPTRGGRVELDGRDVTRAQPWERVRMGLGYIPQERTGFGHLTVAENLRVVLESRKDGRRSEVDEVLDLFPALKPLLKRPAVFLSGGQRQQLAIGRALLTKPRILMLDEPTEGIQPSVVAEIEEAILALHAREGLGILLAEQYVEMALRMADSYVVLEAGSVVARGATAELSAHDAERLLAI
ncbi:ATP-binding cassette domain-containing protein [Conexibacter sp. SYSU D00693]|uniref:ATP-binding cassette domain-containing protein n=1 Tax=Conexibacter sp. SYSU D00693 TaxID=2812560 RepID=UPI00196AFD25|nr:ATP-binding cassette domain-containing protein [Conexibacter sp. SYSU D00693]